MTETQHDETIVVIGQGCWGKGPDLKTARRQWIRHGGTIEDGYNIVTFDSETELIGVDDFGRLHYKGSEPTSREIAPKRATR